MGAVQYQGILHTRNPSARHSNFAVIGAGKQTGEEWIQRPVPRDDSAFEMDRAESARKVIRTGPKLQHGRPEDFSDERAGFQTVDDFAPLVRWRQHDHAPQILQMMTR